MFPNLSKTEQEAYSMFVIELPAILFTKRPSVLVHNDLSDDHILLHKTKVSIIDFSDRLIGDPARDFARLWMYGDSFVTQVYELYRGKKRYKLFIQV